MIVMLSLGGLAIYSLIYSLSPKIAPQESKLWNFIGITSFILMALIGFSCGLIDYFFFDSCRKVRKKVELKKRDYICLGMMLLGSIILATGYVILIYLSIFLSQQEYHIIVSSQSPLGYIILIPMLIGVWSAIIGVLMALTGICLRGKEKKKLTKREIIIRVALILLLILLMVFLISL